MGIDMGALEADARARAMAPAGQGTTVTTGNIITNVYVTQSYASPQAIGEAAGGAVQSGLRGAISDIAPAP